MALFGGTFFETAGARTAIRYVQQGSLTAAKSETTISVSFKATGSTVVLAWGGNIARGDQWNGASASSISGSPYHMRTKSWNLNNVGNQDRSLPLAPSSIRQADRHQGPTNDDGGNAGTPTSISTSVMAQRRIGDPSDFVGQASPGRPSCSRIRRVHVFEDDPSPGYSMSYSADCFEDQRAPSPR